MGQTGRYMGSSLIRNDTSLLSRLLSMCNFLF